MKTRWPVTSMILLAAGCTGVVSGSGSDGSFSKVYSPVVASDYRSDSLLPPELPILNQPEIDASLGAKLALPRPARLGIVGLNPRSLDWAGSEAVFRLERSGLEATISALRRCSRIGDAVVVPSIMLREKDTLPAFRDSAARCQLDLLLICSSRCVSYSEGKSKAHREKEGYCVIEVVLLDVKTGLVPFTRIAIEEYAAAPEDGDKAEWESVRLARIRAVSTAMGKVLDDLTKFLTAIP